MRPSLLIIRCLLIDLVQCFSITGVPDQVTERQPVTFTWFWRPGDPTKVLLARTRSDAPVAEILDNSISITANIQTQGILTQTFPDAETVSMVGYDLDQVNYDSIVRDGQPRPFVE
ncbi:hypothetical protein PM082_014991 [Marasmius tenuissimus]|nr:hypothetical protein PM082_014991 [Marasmius tenuissimus]